MALLDESDWDSQYELMFSLWLERAECEFLTGNFDEAEQLIAELLQRGASKVDLAAVYHLKVQLHVVKSENPQAVDSALYCLHLFGIDFPAHPTWEQVQAEYETVWRSLDGRPIESLIDLPLMTDPELQAAMRVLSVLTRRRLLYRFQFVLLAPVPHGEHQHAARDERRFRARPLAGSGYPRSGLSPLPRGLSFRQACMRPGREARLRRLPGEGLPWRWRMRCLWTQPIATAIDFMRARLSHRNRDGGSYLRLLLHEPICR